MKIRKLLTKKFYNIGPWCIDYLLSLSVVVRTRKARLFSLAANGRKKLNIKTVSVEHFSTVFLFFSPFPLLFKVFFKCHFWQCFNLYAWLSVLVSVWHCDWATGAVLLWVCLLMNAFIYVCFHVWMLVCIFVWLCECMYLCVCVH
jgi:hypothetical protein